MIEKLRNAPQFINAHGNFTTKTAVWQNKNLIAIHFQNNSITVKRDSLNKK